MFRSTHLLILFCCLCPAFAQTPGYLKLRVIEGDGAFNDITHKMSHAIVIEVRNESDETVSGAQVVFTLPYSGPSGEFPNRDKTSSTVSDSRGLAESGPFRPNSIEGRFNVKVVATDSGKQGQVIVNQSNTLAGAKAAQNKGAGGKKFWILALVGGGAAAGVAIGVSGSSHSSTPVGPPPTTLAPGPVVVGGPR